jgi:peptide-methionine (S)-S-oxide reductase
MMRGGLGVTALAGVVLTEAHLPSVSPKATAVLAGGCFWGVEAVYEHVRGVKDVVSGFAVPAADSTAEPRMASVSRGYVEAVRITYDPAEVSYRTLLQIFFAVAHDPTEVDRQGPDVGPEYRSAILFSDLEQRQTAEAYLAELRSGGAYGQPIATEVVPLKSFREAEPFHQDFVKHHPDEPYVIQNDAPKIEALRQRFPEWYRK